MTYTVVITYWPRPGDEERYLAAWNALGERLAALPVTVRDGEDPNGRSIRVVECETQRGEGGAYGVHNLACRHGALAVVK